MICFGHCFANMQVKVQHKTLCIRGLFFALLLLRNCLAAFKACGCVAAIVPCFSKAVRGVVHA
jgi:hypothetical protein